MFVWPKFQVMCLDVADGGLGLSCTESSSTIKIWESANGTVRVCHNSTGNLPSNNPCQIRVCRLRKSILREEISQNSDSCFSTLTLTL